MKRMLLGALSLVCALSLGFAAVGCQNGSENPGGEQGEKVYTITLNETSLALNRYATQEIGAVVYLNGERQEGETLTWASDNEEVATVTGGTVLAVDDGRAVITATHASGASAQCNVTVTTSQIPVLNMLNEVPVLLDDSVNLNANLVFNGEDTSDAQFTYDVADDEIATVDENGNVTGKNPGDTTVSVSVNWRGYATTGTAEISVKEDVAVSLESEPVVIYSSNVEIDGKPYSDSATLTATVQTGGGEDRTDGTVTWYSDDTNVATVTDGKIQAKDEGTTEVYFEYATEKNPDFPYTSNKIQVTVQYPAVEKNDIFVDVDKSVSTNKLDGNEIFGKDVTVVGAYEADDVEMQTNYYTQDNFVTTDLPVGERQMLVCNSDGYGYIINVTVATKIMYKTTDLTGWQDEFAEEMETKNGGYIFSSYGSDAYFILGDDIDFENASIDMKALTLVSGATYLNGSTCTNLALFGGGFMGTFDGRGHTISNVTVGSGGFFGALGKGAVIKNTAFVNITIAHSASGSSKDRAGVLGFAAGGATIENCYFDAKSTAKDVGTIAGMATRNTIKNCVVVSDIATNDQAAALINWDPNGAGNKYSVYENVLVLYKNTNKYLIGSTKEETRAGVFTAEHASADRDAISESGFDYGALNDYFDASGAIPVFKTAVNG